MKRLDLNIEFPEGYLEEVSKESKEPVSSVRVASNLIKRAVESSFQKVELKQNQQGITVPTATAQPTMDDQYQYVTICNTLDSEKDGIAVFNDDSFKVLKERFADGRLPMVENMSKILYLINESIKKADIEKKE